MSLRKISALLLSSVLFLGPLGNISMQPVFAEEVESLSASITGSSSNTVFDETPIEVENVQDLINKYSSGNNFILTGEQYDFSATNFDFYTKPVQLVGEQTENGYPEIIGTIDFNQNASGSVVKNLSFTGTSGIGIYIHGSTSNFTIEGNEFIGEGTYNGIIVDEACSGITISNNTFTGSFNDCIDLSGTPDSTTATSNVLIQGNTFKSGSGCFVEMDGADGVLITSNTVSDATFKLLQSIDEIDTDGSVTYEPGDGNSNIYINNNTLPGCTVNFDVFSTLPSEPDANHPLGTEGVLNLNDNYWGENPSLMDIVKRNLTYYDPSQVVFDTYIAQEGNDQQEELYGFVLGWNIHYLTSDYYTVLVPPYSDAGRTYINYPRTETIKFSVIPSAGYKIVSVRYSAAPSYAQPSDYVYNAEPLGNYEYSISFPNTGVEPTLLISWQSTSTGSGGTVINPPSNDSGDSGSGDNGSGEENEGFNNGVPGTGEGFTEPGSTTKPTDDGGSVTFTQDEDGTKTAATQSPNGEVTSVDVTVPSSAITDGKVSVDLGTNKNTGNKLTIVGNKTDEEVAPSLDIKLPVNTKADVEVTVQSGTMMPGTVAMVEDENGNLVPIPTTTSDGNVLNIPLDGSQKVYIVDNAKTFADTAGVPSYATNAAAYVSARDLMTGMGTTEPKPFSFDSNLTRGQFATILYRLEGEPKGSGTYPEGIIPGAWNADAARWAVQMGLMGQGGAAFNPQGDITREQIIAILWRLQNKPIVSDSKLDGYNDVDQIQSDDFKQAMAWAVSIGIVGQGTDNLDPNSDASRAEIAAMIQRYIQKIY